MALPRAQIHTSSLVARIRNVAHLMRRAKRAPVRMHVAASPPAPKKHPLSEADYLAVITDSDLWRDQLGMQYVFTCKACKCENRVMDQTVMRCTDQWLAYASVVHKFKHQPGCARIEKPYTWSR